MNWHRYPATVLLVDDDPAFVETLADELTRLSPHLRVMTAGDGFEAMAAVRAQQVHLIVTDLKMPEMDGVALLQALRREGCETAAVVVSAFASGEIRERLRQLEVLAVIEKPIDLDELTALILESSYRVAAQGQSEAPVQKRSKPTEFLFRALGSHPAERIRSLIKGTVVIRVCPSNGGC